MPTERAARTSSDNQRSQQGKSAAQKTDATAVISPKDTSEVGSILALQRLVGNQAVQRLLAEQSSGDGTLAIDGERLPESLAPQFSRLTSPPQTGAVQRDPAPAPAPAAPAPAAPDAAPQASAPVTMDGLTVSNFSDMAGWYQGHILRLQQQISEMGKDNVPPPVSLQTAVDLAQAELPAVQARGQEAIDTPTVLKAQSWLDYKFTRALNDGEAQKGAVTAQRLRQYQQKMQDAQDKLDSTIIPQMRDQQRSAFRNSEDNALLSTADGVATALDVSLTLKTNILAIGENAAELENMTNFAQGLQIIPSANSKLPMIMEIAEKANKVYAGFQLVRAAIDVGSSKKTDADSMKAGVSAMSTIISAGGTLLNASAGLTLYADLYIGPIVAGCLDAMSRTFDLLSKTENRTAIEAGQFDLVKWAIEPGGRPVFDFMLKVMHAEDETGIPTPVPKEVSQYFVDNDSDLSAGTGGKDDLPTKGFWFFKSLDTAKIAHWLFKNRANVWGMLYGAAQVPSSAPLF